ncbi:MAG: vitamin K epoxide reductase [Anaerolineales bacterium]|nr:vitamin K epoxide reductase [Anaerolineales bacterium]
MKKGVDSKWWVSVIAAFIGLLDSIYLTWIKLANATASCSGIGDCESVNNSSYSEVAGIPVALIGAGAYLVILVLLLVEARFPERSELVRYSVFGFSLIGTLYSAYLTYVEVAILNAICPFCVLSALLITFLFVVSVLRLRDMDLD